MLIVTKNNMGYMSTTLDKFGQKFVDRFTQVPGTILDIGAAYGVISHPCLKAGCHVTAVDLEKLHLEELKQTAPKGDNLSTIAGAFPQDIHLPKSSFDGVIVSRVLHFIEGKLIIEGLKKIRKWLKPDGELYIINDTPFIKTIPRLRKIYMERKLKGDLWPGAFHDFPSYDEFNKKHVPEYINLQDIDTLTMALEESGFLIKEIGYMPRLDFPESMQLDGRESVGAIAVKSD